MPRYDDVRRPKAMEDAEIVIRPIESPLALRLGAFLMNSTDLHLGAIWFHQASRTGKSKRGSLESRRDAHFHAALAAYRRCCNEGQRSSRRLRKLIENPAITAADAQRVLSDGASLHKALLELGNQLVGHSSPGFERAAIGARCLWKRDEGMHALIDGWGTTMKQLTIDRKMIERFGLLCYALDEHYVKPEIERMRTLLNQEILAMSPEHIFSRPHFLIVMGDVAYNPMDPSRKYPKPDQIRTAEDD
jgi:hypothetical protein